MYKLSFIWRNWIPRDLSETFCQVTVPCWWGSFSVIAVSKWCVIGLPDQLIPNHPDFSQIFEIQLPPDGPHAGPMNLAISEVFAIGSLVLMLELMALNTFRPRQNGRLFADDTFNRIFLNENVLISIDISLKFVPRGPINDISALVQIMAWRRPGDKPLSEPMMVRLPTHICVTRPQWVKWLLLPTLPYNFPC